MKGRAGLYLLVAAIIGPTATSAQEPPPIEAGRAPAPGEYSKTIDVIHYDVTLGLTETGSTAEGDVRIIVAVVASAPTLRLDFSGMAIELLELDGSPAPFTYADGAVRIPLPGAVGGDTVTVRIKYSGTPDDGLILGETVHGKRAAFVDNWPNRTRFWLPSVDHPADKATVRYTVHAPVDWLVIANGALVGGPTPGPAGTDGGRSTWVWDVGVPISTYNMVVGAAEMTVETVGLAACGRAPASRRPDGCVEVTTWVFPEDADKVGLSFGRAAEMVDFFSEKIGPYPFEKLANVQSATRFGGMENASAIFYSQQGIASGRSMEGTVSHEIAHQWFGDAVTEADWHHLWLSEGFATYFGALFFEHADGEADFRGRMEQSRQRILGSQDTDRPVVDPEEQNLFELLNDNNYPKGGWVLHMLRGILGDEDFFEGVRLYYARHLHAAVLTEDFQAAMEEVSGADLDWFFEQWIHEPGYPTFDVTERWIPIDGVGGSMEVVVRQVQKPDWPRFSVPLTFCWGDGSERECRGGTVSDAEHTLLFEFDQRPLGQLRIDPDGWVLKGG